MINDKDIQKNIVIVIHHPLVGASSKERSVELVAVVAVVVVVVVPDPVKPMALVVFLVKFEKNFERGPHLQLFLFFL